MTFLLTVNDMDPVIMMGDYLLMVGGGAKFSGTERRGMVRVKVDLSPCFDKPRAREKHEGTDM